MLIFHHHEMELQKEPLSIYLAKLSHSNCLPGIVHFFFDIAYRYLQRFNGNLDLIVRIVSSFILEERIDL